MLPKPPGPAQVYAQLKAAITHNKRPTLMLHQFLTSGKTEANAVGNYMIDYRDTILLLTGPAGRRWLHFWLDDLLNFLEKIAKEGKK